MSHRLVILLCWSVLVVAGDYGEQPLRANLSDKPYVHTEGGRTGQRFAAAEVNRYRLYDFYERQALWHLAQPADDATTLLPFPGLDGGRRGHWGVTNETSTEALHRSIEPEFGPLTARGREWNLHYLRGGNAAHPGVFVYDVVAGGVRQVFSDARLVSRPHPLGGKVDRWGFSVTVEGGTLFGGTGESWSDGERRQAEYLGHHLHGERVIYRHRIGAVDMLSAPELLDHGGVPVLLRRFAFRHDAANLSLRLLGGGGRGGNHGSGLLLESEQDGRRHHHLVWHEDGIDLRADGAGLLLERARAGAHLTIATWMAPGEPAAEFIAALRAQSAPVLSTLTHGGPVRFAERVVLAGRRDVDNAGGPYVIDDLPVPVANPWNAPMTLSGLDFAADGTVYVCTLVGDVWRVTGIDDALQAVTWQRIASGLNLPLGLVVVDDVPYVSCRGVIVRLIDDNGDHEIDHVERFSRMELPASESGHDLQRDVQGDFFFNAASGIYRLSRDGTQLTQIGAGSRNPLGLAVRGDGLVVSDSSEGDKHNGTCTLYEAEHAENHASLAKNRRILYLPRGIDNSPGGRLFLDEPRFGPLGRLADGFIGLSYGAGSWYYVLRDRVGDTPQAALVTMPGSFASGMMRVRRNAADGQLYAVGLDGWGDYAVAEGAMHRIRFNGGDTLLPIAWSAHGNALVLRFDQELAEDPSAERFLIQQWTTIDSGFTYGSGEYSLRTPGQLGHDRVAVARVRVGPDRHSLVIEAPGLRPAGQTHVYGEVRSRSGVLLKLNLHATLTALHPDLPEAVPGEPGKPASFVVPEQDSNGNTYQVVTGYFDRLSGRAAVVRASGAEVAWKSEDLCYEWIRQHVIDRQCMPCHAAGTPHDLTTYERLVSRINLQTPAKSHLLGMIGTNSMPPFPFPTVAPSMRTAIEEWIKAGAKR